jgi:hypothetical protein
VLPDRTDRAYAICYSLVGAVLNHKTPERWEAAMIALGVAGAKNVRYSQPLRPARSATSESP